MAAHARRSPSAADRWMVCPASVAACADLPDDRSSIFAAEGTVAHHVRALCLSIGFEPHDFVGQKMSADGFEFEITEEMARHLQPGIDRVRNLPGRMVVEHRVDLAHWLPGDFGTLDCGVIGEDTIWIDDLKFGQGEPVLIIDTSKVDDDEEVEPVLGEEPEQLVDEAGVINRQLRIYALGFWWAFARDNPKIQRFVLSIDQPRVAGRGGEIVVTLDELLAFGEEVRLAGLETERADAAFKASVKGCHYCKRNPRAPMNGPGCGTLDEFALATIGSKFEEVDENIEFADMPPRQINPTLLTIPRLVYIWKHKKMIEGWLEAAHATLLNHALNGADLGGPKAVEGRSGRRFYVDPIKAEAILTPVLGEKTFTKKLISPAEAEKVLKPKRGVPGHPDAWAELDAYITANPGKPALAGAGDPRPPLKTIEQKFDEMEAQGDEDDG
jgi:hypothetical protein